VENTLAGTYPIARPLLMYTLGDPSPAARQYLDWALSDAGQKIVQECGYVPLQRKP
jgi:phosphate transport system substrate-binding protein